MRSSISLLIKIRVIFVLFSLGMGISTAKVVHTKAYPGWPAALADCASGDVLIFDSTDPKTKELSDPPSNLQVIGGSVIWNITKDVSDLVFFNHTPTIHQSGGIMRRVISSNLGRSSKFTGIDSCFFILNGMGRDGVNYEVDGYMRACTFAFNGGFMGASTINFMGPKPKYGETWTKHASCFLINATDPVGDGSGSLITNIISHGQIDWTPVRIINGRGITVAHINSEYGEWSDPFVQIENGVECVNIHHNLGGHQGGVDWNKNLLLNDGTLGYPWVGNRWGAFRIGGMNNSLVGGVNYVGIRTALTGSAWESTIARDPYLTKWNANHGGGINFAPGINIQALGTGDYSMMKEGARGRAYVLSSAEACTTTFMDDDNKIVTSGLKNKALRGGISMYRPYAPFMPRLKLDGDGPGENMTGKSGQEILSALNGGKSIYVGAGIYNIPGSITSGRVYGAGMGNTIFKFPDGTRCTLQGILGLYNLTIQGGKTGYTQLDGYNDGFQGMNVEFKDQSLAGINIGCTQNRGHWFLEFDNCSVGYTTCNDNIPCGENGSGGGKLYDKFNVYSSKFRNLTTGANISGGTDGFLSFIGCRFENISGKALNMNTKGNYVAGSDFIDCKTGIFSKYSTTVQNCSFIGKNMETAITGQVAEVISCSIMGYTNAIDVSVDNAFISDVESDGSVKTGKNAWIGLSKFSNLDVKNGAKSGDQDLTQWINTSEIAIDQTKPSEPKNLTVKSLGSNNYLTWDRSTDEQTEVMQYIIEKNGKEVGRTNLNYSANYHFIIPSGWGPEGFPGPGLYKSPRPVYVDSGAAGTNVSAYKVLAVNFANIRSDDQPAAIRFWPYGVSPYRLTGESVRLADSIIVPLGDLVTTKASGERSYTAVRYKPLSQSGLKRGIRPVSISRQSFKSSKSVTSNINPDAIVKIYSIQGRKVAEIRAGDALKDVTLENHFSKLGLGRGTYLIPGLGLKFTVISGSL